MNISNTTNRLKNIKLPTKLPDNLPAELYTFPLLSGYMAYDSYRKTPDKNKANNLKLNLSVLAGTTLGIWGGYKSFGKIVKNSKKISKIEKDLLQISGAPLGGVVGGFFSGILANKAFPMKPLTEKERKTQRKTLVEKTVKKKEHKEKTKRLKQFGIFALTLGGAITGGQLARKGLGTKKLQDAHLTKTAQKFINGVGLVTGGVLGLFIGDKTLAEKQMIKVDKNKTDYSLGYFLQEASPSLGSFEAGKEADMKNRLKKTFYQSIANVVVPTIFMLPIMNFVRNNLEEGKFLNKSLKKLEKLSPNPATKKLICEKSILIPASVASYALGRYMGDKFDKHVTKKILEQQFWEDLEQLKEDALKDSLEGIASNDTEKTQKAIEKLSKAREIEKRAKENSSPKKN